jgi:hypothetical protein
MNARMKKQHKGQGGEDSRWVVGFEWIMLLIAALFSGIIVTTMYQTVDAEIVDIAVYQIILGLAGVMMGTTINIRKTRLTSGIRVGMPGKKDAEEIFLYVTGGFIGLEIFNQATSMIRFNAWSNLQIEPAMNIALTAAIMEEALYSFAMTTFFFIAILYMIVKIVGRYTTVEYNAAMVVASMIVGVFFVLIHIGVYGTDPTIVLQLFVNRFVYAAMYIKTRNLTVPTLLHLIHNFMVFI